MNDALPGQLRNTDKILPSERYKLINRFWNKLGSYPLGKGNPQVENGFWRPRHDKVFHAKAPDLLFSDGNHPEAPLNGNVGEHKKFYSSRLPYNIGVHSCPFR